MVPACDFQSTSKCLLDRKKSSRNCCKREDVEEFLWRSRLEATNLLSAWHGPPALQCSCRNARWSGSNILRGFQYQDLHDQSIRSCTFGNLILQFLRATEHHEDPTSTLLLPCLNFCSECQRSLKLSSNSASWCCWCSEHKPACGSLCSSHSKARWWLHALWLTWNNCAVLLLKSFLGQKAKLRLFSKAFASYLAYPTSERERERERERKLRKFKFLNKLIYSALVGQQLAN